MTQSERLFADYCNSRGFTCAKIEPESGQGRFPDFRVGTPSGEVIAEVKELTPNRDDREYLETLEKEGKAFYSREPGKRCRRMIQDAALDGTGDTVELVDSAPIAGAGYHRVSLAP